MMMAITAQYALEKDAENVVDQMKARIQLLPGTSNRENNISLQGNREKFNFFEGQFGGA